MLENSLNLLSKNRRLGQFRATSGIYTDKVYAYIAASQNKEPLVWEFNDDIFGAIDWTVPIETSLPELYRQRAQQLRDTYDYISIFFSGGIDSAAVIRAFLDKDIFIDEIVMLRPKTAEVSYDTTGANFESEIMLAAFPWVKAQNLDPRTSVRFMDIEDYVVDFCSSDLLLAQYPYINFLNPGNFCKQSRLLFDPVWNKLYDAGKIVGHIMGIDKPVVTLNKGQYTFRFSDHSPHLFQPAFESSSSLRREAHQKMEFFFWTPSLPELVIKQCQVVKRYCQTNFFAKIITTDSNISSGMEHEYDQIMRHIYPKEAFGVHNLFRARRSALDISAGGFAWFKNLPEYCQSTFFEIKDRVLNNIELAKFSLNGETGLLQPKSRSYVL